MQAFQANHSKNLALWCSREGNAIFEKIRQSTFLQLSYFMVKATSSRTNLDWDTNSQTIDIKQYLPSS